MIDRRWLALPVVLVAAGAALSASAPARPRPQTVVLQDHQWRCHSAQNGTQVNVTITDANVDAIHLDAGCTGRIRVKITTSQRDGIKVHAGVHDLEVWGQIECGAKSGVVHQDGVQAMGGQRVTFKYLQVRCASGNNGGLFVNSGAGGQSVPTDVVCEHCDIFEGNAAVHVGGGSLRSGARDSTLWHGTGRAAPKTCIRVDSSAKDPVNTGNTCRTGDPGPLPPAPKPS